MQFCGAQVKSQQPKVSMCGRKVERDLQESLYQSLETQG
jgi:hypothetical protein